MSRTALLYRRALMFVFLFALCGTWFLYGAVLTLNVILGTLEAGYTEPGLLIQIVFAQMMFYWPAGILAYQFRRLADAQRQAWKDERIFTEQIQALVLTTR